MISVFIQKINTYKTEILFETGDGLQRVRHMQFSNRASSKEPPVYSGNNKDGIKYVSG
jgi:hypothetical protein